MEKKERPTSSGLERKEGGENLYTEGKARGGGKKIPPGQGLSGRKKRKIQPQGLGNFAGKTELRKKG